MSHAFKRFPEDFVWGASASSYQIEGGWLDGGKGLSIWDAFCHTPGKIMRGETGDVACDHFHRFREDVELMARMGLKHYRLSISWPRIQPAGYGPANPAGLQFYSDLVDTLLAHGVTPWVTLYHWDLPLALQCERDGWLNPSIVDCFAAYADIVFGRLGDRVKHWITLNEPWVVAILGHGHGVFAPGRTSTTEPYIVGHNLLRAHGRAVEVYRSKYQQKQGGRIGMANNCDWREPRTDLDRDQCAAERALEFFLGWFADPLYRGDYPASMRNRLEERLPRFAEEERELIKGSVDFFGLNHYTTMYAAQAEPGAAMCAEVFGNGGIAEDQDVMLSTDPAWEKTEMGWAIVPWGCRRLLEWIDARYNRPEIVITENGAAFPDGFAGDGVSDSRRVKFLRAYLGECHAAIETGVKLRGYFVWSLMDNFEWSHGYGIRFGLHHVDYATGKRTPRESAKWYGRVMRDNGIRCGLESVDPH